MSRNTESYLCPKLNLLLRLVIGLPISDACVLRAELDSFSLMPLRDAPPKVGGASPKMEFRPPFTKVGCKLVRTRSPIHPHSSARLEQEVTSRVAYRVTNHLDRPIQTPQVRRQPNTQGPRWPHLLLELLRYTHHTAARHAIRRQGILQKLGIARKH